MKDFYIIKPLKENITSYVFYTELLYSANKYFEKGEESDVVFDFTEVRAINASVLPNLLCLGCKFKSLSNKAKIKFAPTLTDKKNILSYLFDVEFFYLNDKLEIFEIDKLGGYPIGSTPKSSKLYFFPSNYQEPDIFYSYQKSYEVFEKAVEKSNSIYKDMILKELIKLSTELSYNSIKHGKSFSFASVQVVNAFKTAFFSFSDYGIGFKNGLENIIIEENEKLTEDTKKNIDNILRQAKKDKENSTVYYILLAVLYRFLVSRDTEYGLINIFSFVFERNGVIRAHSEDTQIVLTSRLKEYLVPEKILKLAKLVISESSFGNLRRNLNLPGVHIEIEIPTE